MRAAVWMFRGPSWSLLTANLNVLNVQQFEEIEYETGWSSRHFMTISDNIKHFFGGDFWRKKKLYFALRISGGSHLLIGQGSDPNVFLTLHDTILHILASHWLSTALLALGGFKRDEVKSYILQRLSSISVFFNGNYQLIFHLMDQIGNLFFHLLSGHFLTPCGCCCFFWFFFYEGRTCFSVSSLGVSISFSALICCLMNVRFWMGDRRTS